MLEVAVVEAQGKGYGYYFNGEEPADLFVWMQEAGVRSLNDFGHSGL
jgi:hypothetical protein